MTAACNLCEGVNLEVLQTAADGVRAVRCARCRLIFLDPFPKFQAAEHYDEAYYRPWLADQEGQRAVLWRKRARFLDGFARVGRLLDVGCGDGSFLLEALNRGWQVVGTEVSPWASRMLRERRGLTVLEGDLLQIEVPEAPFDVVTMWHVLEHTERPLQLLCKVRGLLADSGIFIAAVPNAGFSLFRIVYPVARLKWLRYYTPGERELHLYHFTPDTLHAMVEKAGFRVVFDGIDESALRLASVLLQRVAKTTQALTGQRWSEPLLVVAMKAGAP